MSETPTADAHSDTTVSFLADLDRRRSERPTFEADDHIRLW